MSSNELTYVHFIYNLYFKVQYLLYLSHFNIAFNSFIALQYFNRFSLVGQLESWVESYMYFVEMSLRIISKNFTLISKRGEEYFIIHIECTFGLYWLYVVILNEVAWKIINSSVQANSSKNDVARSRYKLYMSNKTVKQLWKDNQIFYKYVIFRSYNI